MPEKLKGQILNQSLKVLGICSSISLFFFVVYICLLVKVIQSFGLFEEQSQELRAEAPLTAASSVSIHRRE